MEALQEFDIRDKVILITGSTRGIGKYYAEYLASCGAIVIVSGRDAAVCSEVAKTIQTRGYKADICPLDLSDPPMFNSSIKSIIDSYGKIDVLINNAAISHDMPFFDITYQSWDAHLDTNLKGTFFLTQRVAKYMSKQDGYKKIINIAAINGQKVRKNCIPFSVSKAGILHLTKLMAYELASYQINVNAVSLGLTASEGVKNYLANDPGAEGYVGKIPLNRAGQYEDLAGAILLLSSQASNYMTGSVVNIDGGFSCDVFLDQEVLY